MKQSFLLLLVLALSLAPAALAVPALRRALEDTSGEIGGEGDGTAAAVAVPGEEVEETIERLKRELKTKQGIMKDFILSNGIDNRTYIMGMQEEIQERTKVLKKLIQDNAPPPPPPPYADGTGECVDGDCEEGEGVYEWADGGRFVGFFSNSSKNGRGTYFHEESGNYTGEWKDGYPDGQGTFIAKDNQWNYTGGYLGGMMQGKGVYVFERCRWSMVEEQREHYCANKNRIVLYRGTTAYKGSLSECAGLVQKNDKCGTELYYAGSSTAPTSDCVCVGKGEVCKAKPSQKINHVYKYACDGGKLNGTFTQGAPDGPGSWHGFDGVSYVGEYTMGAMTDGIYTWEDGATFDGPWIGKQPNWDNGTYIGSDGLSYPNRTKDAENLAKAHAAMLEAIEEIEEEELAMVNAPRDDEINSIYITFKNQGKRQVDLYWQDTFMAALKANGDGYRVKSYLGHQWFFKIDKDVVKEHNANPAEGKEQTVTITHQEMQFGLAANAKKAPQPAPLPPPPPPKKANGGRRRKDKRSEVETREDGSPKTVKTLLNDLKKYKNDGIKEDLRRVLLAIAAEDAQCEFFGWTQLNLWVLADRSLPWQLADVTSL